MGTLQTSQKERDRLGSFSRVWDGQMTLVQISECLRLSYRQAMRLWKRHREVGDAGLVHGLRGRPSVRRVEQPVAGWSASRYPIGKWHVASPHPRKPRVSQNSAPQKAQGCPSLGSGPTIRGNASPHVRLRAILTEAASLSDGHPHCAALIVRM